MEDKDDESSSETEENESKSKENDHTDAHQNKTSSLDSVKEEIEVGTSRNKYSEFSRRANIEKLKKENVRDGDYVYGPYIRGVYYRGGIIVDFDEDPNEKEDDEWRNANL